MEFWTDFGRFADVLGIASLLFSGYAAFRLWLQNREWRKQAARTPPIMDFKQRVLHANGVTTPSPVAVAISLVENSESIEGRVGDYLRARDLKMPIEAVVMNGLRDTGDLEQYLHQLRELRRRLELEHRTELHLFFAGPVQAATLAGAVFKNWVPVKLYQKARDDASYFYEYWMPLMDR
jgi:hypothetical protein